MPKLIFATRPSALARWQTQWVMAALRQFHPALSCEEKIITTQGDKILDRPLPEIGGKGLFTQELEQELLSGKVHCAVHSLKDLPVENPPGLVIGCIPDRAETRDVLISASGFTLESLPNGSRVGTSSLRRSAQLFALRPDVTADSLRGNIDTRVRKAMDGQYDAIILAGAGIIRLGLQDSVSQWIPLDKMLPAPGQGALAVQCRADDNATLHFLNALEDASTRSAVTAERLFLQSLGGGCSLPVAAHAVVGESIHLEGLVASLDGRDLIKVSGTGTQPEELGLRLAQTAAAQGASEILAKITSG